jgi:hypothetical protein
MLNIAVSTDPAVWADTCYLCRQPKAAHVGLRLATDAPWCPDDDGTSFLPSDIAECLHPERHEVGCDCAAGVCD